MEEKQTLDCPFDVEENKPQTKSQAPHLAKIILLITLSIIIILIIVIIIIVVVYENKLSDQPENNEEKKTIPKPSPLPFEFTGFGNFEAYGKIEYNLTYDENGKIENSFKETGENYNESIGNLNDGNDYEKNERNIYNLYIPQYALDRKSETNGIILWVHGGAWIGGNLTMMDFICQMLSQQGYISATVGYTLLNSTYPNNIFRILDEITACIKAIKKKLKDLGFNESELLLGIGGHSAGGHLSLLYSYLIKNTNIIPIKFVINLAGPIGLYEKYFYKLKSDKNTLSNIEDISILEQAKNNGTIVPIFYESYSLYFMNYFYGNKFNQSELDSMMFENKTINYTNENYQKMFNVVKNGYVTEIEDKNKLPTLCIYGGIDDILGVSTFAYLKEKMDKDGRPYDFIYTRYEGHNLIIPTSMEGIIKDLEISSKFKQYFKTYFKY